MMDQPTPPGEIPERIAAFQGLLRKQGVDAALIVQKTALYYFAGTDQDAHLWIPVEGDPLLMVRKSMVRAMEDALVEKIVPLPGLSRLGPLIREHGGLPGSIGLELDVLPVNQFRTYQRVLPGISLVDVSALVRQVRTVKSAHEIALIRRAADLGDGLFRRIPGFLEEAETDTALAVKAETFYRSHGHPGQVRMRAFNTETIYGQIVSGPDLSVPSWTPGPTGGPGPGPYASQGSGRNPIGSHVPILIDYVANWEGYLSDQARIFSRGRLPERFHRAHQVMLEVQEALADLGKPGTLAGELYDAALEIVRRAGLTEGFMGHPQPVPFVGHGIGLELDEWPVIGRNSGHVLQVGQVIALEPKVIFPREGAVGIENTFVVGERGLEKLNRFPEEISVLV